MKIEVEVPDIVTRDGVEYVPTGEHRVPQDGEFYLSEFHEGSIISFDILKSFVKRPIYVKKKNFIDSEEKFQKWCNKNADRILYDEVTERIFFADQFKSNQYFCHSLLVGINPNKWVRVRDIEI